MSVFVTTTDLLEEIVETTEEQEADLCSSGETVDEIGEYIEVHEAKYEPVPVAISSSSTRSSSLGNGGGGGGGGSSTRSHKNSSSRSSASSTPNGHAGGPGSANGTGGTPNSSSSTRGGGGGSRGANHHMEQEKRMRREIANSNERRRMQSINAGFQSLRTLLPHHEGEKLSKAAILQQTAEYIYQLEQQKTQLLSQNLQLKRLVGEHEGGDVVVPSKKRRGENGTPVLIGMSVAAPVNESGDEGLGSMSPEPLSVITVSADGPTLAAQPSNSSNASSGTEIAELKRQLERERSIRQHLEKQVKSMETQIFPEQRYHEGQLITYQPHEVIEHTNNVLAQDLEDGIQVVSVVSVPTVGSTQTVETSNADSDTPPMSPQPGCEIIVPSEPNSPIDPKEVSVNDLLQIKSRPTSPATLANCFPGVQVFASALDDQQQSSAKINGASFVTYSTVASLPVVNATASSVGATGIDLETIRIQGQTLKTAFITASPTRSFSPEQQPQQLPDEAGQQAQQPEQQQRLPSVLEAAIKAEPKVEVERLPSPSNSLDDGTPQNRLYLANTSRQNLETIVEAIRHLEGDHLFSDEPAQDVPLALTNKRTLAAAAAAAAAANNKTLLHAEVNNFLQFHSTTQPSQKLSTTSTTSTSNGTGSKSSSAAIAVAPSALQQSAVRTPQQRPGVIVVKHS